MHNDGVAQGLSQVPYMQDVDHWGVLTIGLGNARFTNRKPAKKSKSKDGEKAEKDEKKDKKEP